MKLLVCGFIFMILSALISVHFQLPTLVIMSLGFCNAVTGICFYRWSEE